MGGSESLDDEDSIVRKKKFRKSLKQQVVI